MTLRREHSSKKGGDGLTERERAFALLCRRHPEEAGWKLAQMAGFLGTDQKLKSRANVLMKKGAVLALIRHPGVLPGEETQQDDAELPDDVVKKLVKRRFIGIVKNPRATDEAAIKAGDKLLCTIPGGYVPLQVDQRNRVTMETLVGMMGGAPGQPALPAPEPEPEAEAE